MRYSSFTRRYADYWAEGVWNIAFELEGVEPSASFRLTVAALPPEAAAADYLSLSEQAEYARFQYPRRRCSYLLGKLSAKLALAGEADDLSAIAIEHGIMNQPVVSGSSRKITVTHCDSLGAALAFDQRLLAGVDIELISEQARDALRRITSVEEERLSSGPQQDMGQTAFLTLLWTAKEAMSKVLLTGFTVATELFEVKTLERRKYGVVGRFCNFPQFLSLSVLREEYIFSMVLPAKAFAPGEEDRLLERIHNSLPQLPAGLYANGLK
ncbi:4'-phosphopantetheinyl transferase superfamily protein [Paenibacillus sp. FSL R7-0273]|uniref:4'-phosphopantetheinyl transferase family protein n=1 Tax=Paenibacillus sp. FSL R7-0273 TaxID=1536772 RepID=UPI000693C860|nr:4'-phosphopantetheinyl transferase superfamily protein [Paenibacillus sp. FSL R7-0273]OMF96017.1 hypothetical protein BK144_05415 [Paenibacillus sp. FSL R7-0273]